MRGEGERWGEKESENEWREIKRERAGEREREKGEREKGSEREGGDKERWGGRERAFNSYSKLLRPQDQTF